MRKPLHTYTELAGDVNLNLGCASNLIGSPGEWVNVDKHNADADLASDFTGTAFVQKALVMSNYRLYDFVLASHSMEHVSMGLMSGVLDNVWKLLKPGGVFLAITPHGRSDDAWENPHHRSLFTENTWFYFTPALYEAEDTPGLGASEGITLHPWDISIALVPYDEFKKRASMDFSRFKMTTRHECNIWREVHAILRKSR